MNSETVRAMRQFLFGRETCFLAILPFLISLINIQYQDKVTALIIVCIYYFVISYFLKAVAGLTLSLALFMAIDLALIAFTPQDWTANATFLRSISFPLLILIAFIWFSLEGKPYPQLATEAMYPEIKAWDFSRTKSYTMIWQKESIIWIAGSITQIITHLYLYLALISSPT